jgi:hypothetical protein
MKKTSYLLFFLLLNCASPSAFLGNGVLSLGTSQSLTKAALSTGSDYLIKKETGKSKFEHLSSKVLKKDCSQENNFKLSCK